MTNANPLHHFQMPAGSGFIVKKSSPSIQRASGSTDCISRSRSRNLSMGDQSCTDSRRKTTTTPAKPASATATWAAVLRASLGSVEISFSAKCGVMRAKIHGSLNSPACLCVSITLPASFAIWPRPFVEGCTHSLAVEAQTESIFLRKLSDFCLSVFLVQWPDAFQISLVNGAKRPRFCHASGVRFVSRALRSLS
jgi:hypothetical protein